MFATYRTSRWPPFIGRRRPVGEAFSTRPTATRPRGSSSAGRSPPRRSAPISSQICNGSKLARSRPNCGWSSNRAEGDLAPKPRHRKLSRQRECATQRNFARESRTAHAGIPGRCHDCRLSPLRGLSGFPLHYFYEASQFLVDLPKLIRGKLRRIGDTFVCARHLLMPNVRHEGVVEKLPIAIANCIRCCVVCSCLGHVLSPCSIWPRGTRSPFRVSWVAGGGFGRLFLGTSRWRPRTCTSSRSTNEGFGRWAKPPSSFPPRLLERSLKLREDRVQLHAERAHNGDDRNRDAGGDKSVFDGSGSRFVLEKGRYENSSLQTPFVPHRDLLVPDNGTYALT